MIITKILNNSFKFTGNNGKVIFTMSQSQKNSNEYLLIKISDNGCGISDKKMKDIYNLFNQDKVYTKKYDGLGLGLPITKRILKLIGGEISINSKENCGTEVSILFQYKKSFS